MQATEKAGLIDCLNGRPLFEIALKGRPFSDYSSLLELLEKYEHGNSCIEFIDYTSDVQ